MKRIFKTTASALTFFSIALSAVCGFAAADVIKINGTPAEIPAEMGVIMEKDSRTFVPVRFVSEFLKYDVWFDDETKTAYVASDETLICIQNDNSVLYALSKTTGETTSTQMDTEAFINDADSRMYLPIRYLAEALNYNVGWDEETQTVSIDSK